MKPIEQIEIDQFAHEIIKLRKKANNSNNKALQEQLKNQQQIFVDKFKYLVINRTNKYRKFSNHKDLEQDGFEALILALKTYDPSKGSFTWWADKYISTRVSRAANTHSTIRVPLKKARAMKPYKTSTIPILVDSHPDPENCCEQTEISQIVSDALGKLSPEQQNIISLIYGFQGMKPHSFGTTLKILSISRSQCLKLLEEAKSKLKDNIDANLLF